MCTLFNKEISDSIIDRIDQLNVNSPRKWGKMNVSQMLLHLNEALGTATGDTTTKTPFLLKLMAPLIKKVVMSNKPYKEGLPTAKEFIIKADNLDFDKEKTALLNRLSKFITNGEAKVEGLKHPAFGTLTAYEWGFSQWKHFDHHLKQFGV